MLLSCTAQRRATTLRSSSGSGLTSVDTSARQEWEIDHGALAGLSDDDHPQYMQPVEAGLQVLSAFAPAQSGAAVSTCGTVLPQPVAKYPACKLAEMNSRRKLPPCAARRAKRW